MALDEEVVAMSQPKQDKRGFNYLEFTPVVGSLVSLHRHRRGKSTVYTHPNEAVCDLTSIGGVISQMAGYLPLIVFALATADRYL